MAEPILEIQNLSAGYEGVPVLRGVDVVLNDGQVCGLIGPNGHGKTTLLRAISGLIPVTGGSVSFEGTEMAGRPIPEIVNRGIIHVPQGDLLFGEMTVLDNLLIGATRPEASDRIADSLDLVYSLLPRLKERSEQSAFTLSGGERRMLAIGRGLMSRGRVLMLDEPSLGLAPALIDEIYAVIQELAKTGQTVFMVEENAGRAAEVSDHLVLMDHGEIAWQGTPAEMSSNMSIDQTYFGG